MLTHGLRRSVCSTFLVVVAATFCGCAQPDRVGRENYSQVRTGVHTADDVAAILGEPDSKLADMWIYQRPDRHLNVIIEFDAKGRVARTQWVDALGETWEDSDEKKPPGM